MPNRLPRCRVALALLLALPWAARAAEGPGFADCALIGAAVDRLACYDRAAGRATEPVLALPPVVKEDPASEAAKAKPEAQPEPEAEQSRMSQFWELDRSDKRGVFNFIGYRPNYILPLHLTNGINRSPQSPTQPDVRLPAYRDIEAKMQLSLRTKLAQSVLLPDADIWFGYTQQSMWQLYNGADSKPFRNTDYEPEVIYVVPTPRIWRQLPLGWQWRFGQVGFAHQSNGQADPLSRSWNRAYLGAGFERGDWSLTARVLRRFHEDREDDNNPDLTDYRGRGDLQLNWFGGRATASLLYRSTFKSISRGALQVDWSYPVYDDQPNGLRWFVQLFTGYGETLTDYNFRQTSIGAGLTFFQF
jgi:phospholipase A1/A2